MRLDPPEERENTSQVPDSRLHRPPEVGPLVTVTPSRQERPGGPPRERPCESDLFEGIGQILRLLGGPPQKAILT